jgi:hypothetical protein
VGEGGGGRVGGGGGAPGMAHPPFTAAQQASAGQRNSKLQKINRCACAHPPTHPPTHLARCRRCAAGRPPRRTGGRAARRPGWTAGSGPAARMHGRRACACGSAPRGLWGALGDLVLVFECPPAAVRMQIRFLRTFGEGVNCGVRVGCAAGRPPRRTGGQAARRRGWPAGSAPAAHTCVRVVRAGQLGG